LFGHSKGAFTGAVTDKEGKVERANHGTLFLDEISEVPFYLQAKLLRLVDERSFERVGDPVPRMVNARIIAATNRDLVSLIKEKAFREDLFYRLNVVDLSIPALRNRPEDILLLAGEFLASFGRAHNKPVTEIDNNGEKLLLRYSWPGNVRELSHAMERAVLLAPGGTLHVEHLPQRLLEMVQISNTGPEITSLAEIEEKHIRKVLALNLPIEEAAHRLNIDPSTLWRKRKKYNI
jgi:NtrC-family two-component system response regulator AlgB